jgi:hypothetical protein
MYLSVCNCVRQPGDTSPCNACGAFKPAPKDPPTFVGMPMQQGWLCPKCGTVNGPMVNQCPCSWGNSIKITNGSGTLFQPLTSSMAALWSDPIEDEAWKDL